MCFDGGVFCLKKIQGKNRIGKDESGGGVLTKAD